METQEASTVWKETCRELSSILSKDVYDRWIAVIEAKEVRDDQLILHVANDFYHTWLAENYLPLIQDTVAAAAGRDLRITFEVDRAHKETAPQKKHTPRRNAVRKRSQNEKPSLNQNYTFDRLSSARRTTLRTPRLSPWPSRRRAPTTRSSSTAASGLGKTHLMQAIGHHVLAQHEPPRVLHLLRGVHQRVHRRAPEARPWCSSARKYRNADVLLIDDIQFLGGKERMQEEFFHTFNALFDTHKQIVMTCDRPASEIPGPRAPPGLPLRVGPGDRTGAAGRRNAHRHSAQEAGTAQTDPARGGPELSRRAHPLQHPPPGRRADPGRLLRLADRTPTDHRGPGVPAARHARPGAAEKSSRWRPSRRPSPTTTTSAWAT